MNIYSNSPIVCSSKLLLFKPTVIENQSLDVNITVECEWLLESETQVEYWHGGKLIKNGSCYNDFYGLLSCMDKSHGESASNEYNITPESSLEVRMVTTLSAIPVKRQVSKMSSKISEFKKVGSGLWFRAVGESPPILCETIILEKCCTWSSFGENEKIRVKRQALQRYFDSGYSLNKLSESLLALGIDKENFSLNQIK
jgi:hypothetical protein